jgi:hypothetical protein
MNSANIENSARLKRALRLLVERGEDGATTREICEKAQVIAVSAAVDELRDNGYSISCQFVETTPAGSRVYRYWYAGYDQKKDRFHAERKGPPPLVSKLVDADPPAPLEDSDSVREIGYRLPEIPEPPPDVPPQHFSAVLAFERALPEEREKYEEICRGRAADKSCLCCTFIIENRRFDIFPSFARKSHVMACCNPELDSNRKYLRGA